MNIKKTAFGMLAFFVSSFLVQGILGFVVAGEYFMSIGAMRQEPLVYLGMASTLVTGVAMASLYPLTRLGGTPVIRGLKFGLLTGLILVPFIALDIPGRFSIPDVGMWTAVQGVLGMAHFALAGVLIGWIYGADDTEHPSTD